MALKILYDFLVQNIDKSEQMFYSISDRTHVQVKEEIVMKRRMGNISFAAATFILVLVMAFCCTGAALSRTNVSAQELEGYYQELEKGLVEDARLLLSERGFANSGVMLTRVIDENGSRQYTLTVHHGRISKMSDEDRQILMAELEQIVFEDDNSIFFHKFFENH